MIFDRFFFQKINGEHQSRRPPGSLKQQTKKLRADMFCLSVGRSVGRFSGRRTDRQMDERTDERTDGASIISFTRLYSYSLNRLIFKNEIFLRSDLIMEIFLII